MARRLYDVARRRARAIARMALLACAILILMTPAVRAEGDPKPQGSSDSASKESARRSIPWNQLTQRDRRIAHYLVRNHSVFRRMPTRVVECDPQVFTFLAQNPEVVSGIWNVMGVSSLEVKRTSATSFQAADRAGTSGGLRVMHADWGPDAANRVVLYAEGVYEAAPLPKAVKAHSLLVLTSNSSVASNGEPYVTARLDSFIYFERAAADLVAKTISPLINRTADHNFTETMKFVSTFSQTAEENPSGMIRLASRIENLTPEVQTELAALCQATASRDRQASLIRGQDSVR